MMQHNSKENTSSLQKLIELVNQIKNTSDSYLELSTLSGLGKELIKQLDKALEFEKLKQKQRRESISKTTFKSETDHLVFSLKEVVDDIANKRETIKDVFKKKKKDLTEKIQHLSDEKTQHFLLESNTPNEFHDQFNSISQKLQLTPLSTGSSQKKSSKSTLKTLLEKVKHSSHKTLPVEEKKSGPSLELQISSLKTELDTAEKSYKAELANNEIEELKVAEQIATLKLIQSKEQATYDHLLTRDAMVALLRFYWAMVDTDIISINAKKGTHPHQAIQDQKPALQSLLKRFWCEGSNRSAWTLVETFEKLNKDTQHEIKTSDKPSKPALEALFFGVIPMHSLQASVQVGKIKMLTEQFIRLFDSYPQALDGQIEKLKNIQRRLTLLANGRSLISLKEAVSHPELTQHLEKCKKALETNFEKAAEDFLKKIELKLTAIKQINAAVTIVELSFLDCYKNYLASLKSRKEFVEFANERLIEKKKRHYYTDMFSKKFDAAEERLNQGKVELEAESKDLTDQAHFEDTKEVLLKEAQEELAMLNKVAENFLDEYPKTHEKDKKTYVTAKAALFYEDNLDALQVDNEFMWELIKYYYVMEKIDTALFTAKELRYKGETVAETSKSKPGLFTSNKKVATAKSVLINKSISGDELAQLKLACANMASQLKYLISLCHADEMRLPFHSYYDAFKRCDQSQIDKMIEGKAPLEELHLILPSYPIPLEEPKQELRKAMNA